MKITTTTPTPTLKKINISCSFYKAILSIPYLQVLPSCTVTSFLAQYVHFTRHK